MRKQATESGFALLITLIVVGVVLSVGLSILDLSIKQVRLSTNAKDSELAFHAANAGMECAQYWRRRSADLMESGQSFSPICFGQSATPIILDITDGVTGTGDVYQYRYSFTWGNPDYRCTQINSVIINSDIDGGSDPGVRVTNEKMKELILGYPGDANKVCDPGSRCSVISVKGYNKPCSNINGYGVIQREVLLQF